MGESALSTAAGVGAAMAQGNQALTPEGIAKVAASALAGKYAGRAARSARRFAAQSPVGGPAGLAAIHAARSVSDRTIPPEPEQTTQGIEDEFDAAWDRLEDEEFNSAWGD